MTIENRVTVLARNFGIKYDEGELELRKLVFLSYVALVCVGVPHT